eukprot:2961793-Prymnesium_polylepis.1
MSKPELLKHKWGEDMTQNVQMARESLRKPKAGLAKARKSARRKCCPKAAKAAKAAKMAAFGRPKAAKATHPPRRPLNCESDSPLKTTT